MLRIETLELPGREVARLIALADRRDDPAGEQDQDAQHEWTTNSASHSYRTPDDKTRILRQDRTR